MNLDQLSAMTEIELQAKANEHFENMDSETGDDIEKEHHLSQAQFYLAEIERRKQARERIQSEKIAARDYKLERWVVVLIGLELILAVVAIIVGWIEGVKQTKVLDDLNRSSTATAVTLAAVRQAQEAALDTQKHTLDNIVAMNDTLQDEMDLHMTEAIQFSAASSGPDHDEAYFSNNGGSILSLWGSKFGDEPPTMRQRPKELTPGLSAPFDITRFVEKAKITMRDGSQVSIPFELYLKRQNGTKYVAKGAIQVHPPNHTVFIGKITTARQQW